ncbi:MAG: hypothetical protein ACK4M7_07050, partial [Burkholderiales bacterium]
MHSNLSNLLQKVNEGDINSLIALYQLMKEIPSDDIKQSVSLQDKRNIFYQAFQYGYIPVLHLMLELVPDSSEQEEMFDMLTKRNAEILYQINIDKQIDTIKFLIKHINKDSSLYNKLYHLNTFIDLASHRQYEELLHFLQTLPPEEASQLIHIEHDWLFIEAASHGHIALMEFMLTLTPERNQQYKMLHTQGEKAFNTALRYHLNAAQLIYHHTSDAAWRERMIHNNDEEPFINTAHSLNYEAIQWLLNLPQDNAELSQMIHAGNDFCFLYAIDENREEIIDLLWDHYPPDEQDNMIHHLFPIGVARAANSGHIHLIKKLIHLIPDSFNRISILQRILQYQDYIAFKRAAEEGHVEAMKELLHLAGLANIDKQQMIHANDHEAFCRAAGNQRLAAMEFLKEQTPDKATFQQMLRSHNHCAFKVAMLRDIDNYKKYCDKPNKNGGFYGKMQVNPKVIEFFIDNDTDHFVPLAKEILAEASIKVQHILDELLGKNLIKEINEINTLGILNHDT